MIVLVAGQAIVELPTTDYWNKLINEQYSYFRGNNESRYDSREAADSADQQPNEKTTDGWNNSQMILGPLLRQHVDHNDTNSNILNERPIMDLSHSSDNQNDTHNKVQDSVVTTLNANDPDTNKHLASTSSQLHVTNHSENAKEEIQKQIIENPDLIILLPNVTDRRNYSRHHGANTTAILRNHPTIQVGGELQSKGILDLLPWEMQSIRNFTNASDWGGPKQLGICDAPPGISNTCCPGSFSGGGEVTRAWAYHCFHGEAVYDRVAQIVLQEVERTNHMVQHDQCDLCRIVEIINQHNLRFAITGDSMMSQNMDGFLCELGRRGYNVTEVYHKQILSGMVGMNGIWTYEISGPPHWQQATNVSFLFQYRPHQNMSEMQHIAVSYDVLMMNFGLHYGYERNGHGQDKEGYENVMATIFNVTRQGNITLLAHRETSAQHHNYSGGEWAKSGRTKCVSHSPNDSHIIGWREQVVQAKAKELGYKVVVADETFPLANDKPVAGQRELVILPFFNLTAKLHYFHPDECTHYCSTPYLWMPIWRSLRLAMDRQWSA